MASQKPPALAQADTAFNVTVPDDTHVIDVLIRERCPSLSNSFAWPLIRPPLYAALGYGDARRTADRIGALSGKEAFDDLVDTLAIDVQAAGVDRLPKTGAAVVVANHPTGLADGIALWEMIREVRRDVVFFANADALRVGPHWSDLIIPVEWVKDKRSPAKARETLKRARTAFSDGQCVVIFPSGVPARKIDGQVKEQDWFATALTLARKSDVPVWPVGIDARNSWTYYFLSSLSKQLRDITLFRELINKSGTRFGLSVGGRLDPEHLAGDAQHVTDALKAYTCTTLIEAGTGADAFSVTVAKT